MVGLLVFSLYVIIALVVYIGLYLHREKINQVPGDFFEVPMALLWPAMVPFAVFFVFVVYPIGLGFNKLNKKLDVYKNHLELMKSDKEYALKYRMKRKFK